jgi:hypothetical protein
MFAMLLGAWPRVLVDGTRVADLEADAAAGRAPTATVDDAVERLVGEAVDAQVEAGMGFVTDGSVRWADPAAELVRALEAGDAGPDGLLVRAWRATAARTDRPVAQVVPGPWTLARLGLAGPGDPAALPARARALADTLAGELEALGEAGCPAVQVLEHDAVTIGADPARRGGFLEAHRRLLARAGGVHAMLAVVGGSAADAGAETILGAPYESLLVDLVAGPDNWRLVRAAPGERGIVCAALEAGDGRERRDQAPELVWAARYAASANGRGLDRVGLANGSPLGSLTPAEARTALDGLGRAAALAGMPVDAAMAAGLDPRVQPHPLRRPGRPRSDA